MTSTAIHGGGNITQRMVHNSMLHNHNSKHSRQHGNTPTCNLTRKHSNRRPTVSPHPTHQHLSKHCITQSSPPTLIRPTLSNAQPPLRHTNQRATAQDIHRALRLALRNVSLLTLPYLTLLEESLLNPSTRNSHNRSRRGRCPAKGRRSMVCIRGLFVWSRLNEETTTNHCQLAC